MNQKKKERESKEGAERDYRVDGGWGSKGGLGVARWWFAGVAGGGGVKSGGGLWLLWAGMEMRWLRYGLGAARVVSRGWPECA